MEIVQVNSIKAWLLAARPKTLAGAATPVLLGCALAYADSCFQMTPALLCFLFAFLMQIDANFINDYFDYLKGSDREDHEERNRPDHSDSLFSRVMPISLWRD